MADIIEAEVIDQRAASIPPEMSIMKLENDNITALAAARPRNHKKIREDLLEQIKAYPSFARDVIYCKPCGKGPDGQMKYARGLSIRAAEAVAEAYGYCRVRADVFPLPDGKMKIEATFTDYQRGRIWQDSDVVSPFYRDRNGRMVRIPEDRFLNITVKAAKSKLIREVILRSVPPGLRSELMELTEQQLDELLDDKTVQKIIAQYAGIGVTEAKLSEHLGRSTQAGWTKEDRRDLLGLWNAIKNEETTVAEAFGTDEKKAESPPSNGAGQVTGKDLTGGAAKIEPERTSQKPADATTPSEAPKPQPAPQGDPDGPKSRPVANGKGKGAKAAKPEPLDQDKNRVTKEQLGRLSQLAGSGAVSQDELDYIISGYGVGGMDQLTGAQADDLIGRLGRSRREPGDDSEADGE